MYANCCYRDRRIDSSFIRREGEKKGEERINLERRADSWSVIRVNYVDAALLRVGTIYTRFRPAEFRISFASSKQDPHYRCGGTVTVRFCASLFFSLRAFRPVFSIFLLLFLHSSREREWSERVGVCLLLWGVRKGGKPHHVVTTRDAPRACIQRGWCVEQFARHIRYSQKLYFT